MGEEQKPTLGVEKLGSKGQPAVQYWDVILFFLGRVETWNQEPVHFGRLDSQDVQSTSACAQSPVGPGVSDEHREVTQAGSFLTRSLAPGLTPCRI